MSLVVPAVLLSSHKDLEEKLAIFADIPSVDRVQIDVVDGNFASPASWPYTVPGELSGMITDGEMLPELDHIEYEIDLMCFDAELAAGQWLSIGASRLTFHAESVRDISRLLGSTRQCFGDDCVEFGLALNITSDLSIIEPYISQVSYVQFMGIASIGRQGQAFDWRVFEKVRVFHERHPEIPMQVDGGVSLQNAKKLVALGVSKLIIGSAILRASDPALAIAELESLQSTYGV
ncbi:MAG: hypothetical protein WCW36_02485 [Candidatus Paceibacterota bacterium]|jgi:ribulose-phosphate 3-epimerase